VIGVRSAGPDDRDRVAAFLEERDMRYGARLGELHDPLGDEAFVAEDERGELVGVLTYQVVGTDCEVTTLYTAASWRGTGSALIEAAVGAAREAGCERLWLVTTNDNVDALRFYQRRGFRLSELRVGAVDDSRARLKPSISELGAYGIPLHDELVLEQRLQAPRQGAARDAGRRTGANLDHDTQPTR
jgi:GNAT superfamily N-acetyltransferase